jgi:predicted short-subunit dehydrogenase-like oxidoreductase (DUF2520 family)
MHESFKFPLGIIGGGRAAWAFGSLWRRAGWSLTGIALRPGSTSRVPELLDTRRMELPELVASSGIVLVAVSDEQLEDVARSAVAAGHERAVAFFHPAGVATSDVFAPVALRFSLHPLRALPLPGSDVPLDGALFAFEGEPGTEAIARRIVDEAGGRLGTLPKSGKILYHAAAVLASNHVALLADVARDLFAESRIEGWSDEDVAELARSAIGNWAGAPRGGEFTGPAARGDRATIEAHLSALAREPEVRELYVVLTRELARRAASRAPQREEIEALRAWLASLPFP